jgi:hypothetical protein
MTDLTTTTDRMVEEFLAQAEHQAPVRKRLIFAVDATGSRQPTWDMAVHVQGQMFLEASRYGGIDVQLVFYRGAGELKATAFFESAAPLVQAMSGVTCRGGLTQLEKVLQHIAREHEKAKIAAAILVGDCCEEELEDVGCAAAEVKVPVYCFLEGSDTNGRAAFELIAKLTRGAVIPFDTSSPGRLRELLGAVAAYIVGGAEALAGHRPEIAALLTHRRTP